MHITQRKEQFSVAYVKAVAAVAGFRLSKTDVDDDSLDWTLAARGLIGKIRSPKIDFQLKCCGRDVVHATNIHYQLKKKNYDELRHPDYHTPRLLVVVLTPAAINDWLLHDEERLALQHCGYWASLRGYPEIGQQGSRIIQIPRAQQFSVTGVVSLMSRLGSGERL
jgi:hypothetical protein